MANRRKMTAAERERFEAIKARIAAKKAAEDTEEEKAEEETPAKETEEREANAKKRAYARYLARKKAQMVEKDDEEEENIEIPEVGTPEEPAMDIQPNPEEEEEKESACGRKRAQEISDDLTGPEGDSSNIEQMRDAEEISDDLTTPDEGDGGIEQTPPPSVDEAESKVLAAYALIERQIAQKVIASNVRKASLAHEYCKTYTVGEMKFAAEQLERVGSAKKVEGSVRVTKRTAGMGAKTASAHKSEIDQILFY